MEGIFDLKTPDDLRGKLRRDLAKLREAPLDADAAFNFFVTAEHMLDWVYPKHVNDLKRTQTRESSIYLQVCSHLANGAKHFEVEAKRHKSVDDTGQTSSYFPPSYFPPSYFPPGYFGGGRLIVHLKGDAANALGQTIGVIGLAEKIMEFWDAHPLS
jgi:hypothetical protein